MKCSSNVKEAVINGDTIEEEEEKEEEENVETPENEQIIASELERIKSRGIRK